MNGLTTLPDPLTECPRCGGEIDDDHLPDRLLCHDCDDWLRVLGDLDKRLRRHEFADIVEHGRQHPSGCYCDACRFARANNAAGYL